MTMRYWLYPQYYGGRKGPTLRGALWKWIKRVFACSSAYRKDE
jgi:hypothetical protein